MTLVVAFGCVSPDGYQWRRALSHLTTNSTVPMRAPSRSAWTEYPLSNRSPLSFGSNIQGHVAVVTHSRPYPAASVLQALVHAGFLTVERPAREDAVQVVNELEPSRIVLAIGPRRDRDIQLSRVISSKTKGAVLALSPGGHPDVDAAVLKVGADVSLHDSEVADLFDAPVGAFARRVQVFEPEPPTALGSIVAGRLVVDLDRREVLRGETRIGLTPAELKLLRLLASNAGRVCSVPDLFKEVQGYDSSISESRELVKVYIRRIRRKIEDDPANPELIVNVRGFGYLLETGSEAPLPCQAIAA